MAYRKTNLTYTRAQWEAIYTYLRAGNDPHFMASWLRHALDSTPEDTSSLTLPTYGVGTESIDLAASSVVS